MEGLHPLPGQWEWDDNERGIVFISHPDPTARIAGSRLRLVSRTTLGPLGPAAACPSLLPGCLLASLVGISFVDVVDARDQVRFKRHWQRRAEPGRPDLVTLRDVKDVVLFQVQQVLPADFLQLFHSAAVDRFLRTLILYCSQYTQTWEWMTFSAKENACRIQEPGLRPSQRRQQRHLSMLRVLLARDYHSLLLGEGGAHKFHHMANGMHSWTQRDARLWELLLRVAVRLTWVALRRRHMNLIDTEVGRLFRGEAFNLAARRPRRTAASQPRKQPDVREEVLHGGCGRRSGLFTTSPATLQLLEPLDGDVPHWLLLALGRMPLPNLPGHLRRLEAAYCLSEEQLAQELGLRIGILGMSRDDVDVMLNVKHRRDQTAAPGPDELDLCTLFPTPEPSEGDSLQSEVASEAPSSLGSLLSKSNVTAESSAELDSVKRSPVRTRTETTLSLTQEKNAPEDAY